MGKKIVKMLEELKPKFINGGKERGHDEKILEKICLANLRTGQSHAVRSCQRLEHVGEQLLQVRIVRWNILGHLSQYGLAININR